LEGGSVVIKKCLLLLEESSFVNPSSLRGRQSGTAPHAEVRFSWSGFPLQYVIPTTFFIDGFCSLITALGLTSYLDNVLGKIIRGVVFLISINFLYIGILIPFFTQLI